MSERNKEIMSCFTSPNVVVAVSAKFTITVPEPPVLVGEVETLVGVGEDDLAPI